MVKKRGGPANKRFVVALVEHGGRGRMFHVQKVTKNRIAEILRTTASRKSALMTDESRLYKEVGKEFASHESVRHSANEYVRGDAHTNTVEGYFSIFKRGMIDVYQHCSEKHLHRYLAEFEFRYNERKVSDSERAEVALKGIIGRRLTYRRANDQPSA